MKLRFKSSGDLFQQLPIADVARVLERTKLDAENKREQLRELVGERYHELIDSADCIVGMNSSVVEFESLMVDIDREAGALLSSSSSSNVVAETTTTTTTSPKKKTSIELATANNKTGESSDERRNVAFLLKAPSEIWTHLHLREHARAAEMVLETERLVRSRFTPLPESIVPPAPATLLSEEEVRKITKAGVRLGLEARVMERVMEAARGVAAERHLATQLRETIWGRFPYLRSHWNLLKTCREDVVKSAREFLGDRTVTDFERTRDALEALAILGEIREGDVLDYFLETRVGWLKRVIVEPSEHPIDEGGGEIAVEACFEIVSRTLREMDALVSTSKREDNNNNNHHRDNSGDAGKKRWWLTERAMPVAREACARHLSRIPTLSRLASLKSRLRELDGALADDRSSLAPMLSRRASELLAAAREEAVRAMRTQAEGFCRVKNFRLFARSAVAKHVVSALVSALREAERDAALFEERVSSSPPATSKEKWVDDLIAWLGTNNATHPLTGRICEAILAVSATPPVLVLTPAQSKSCDEIATRCTESWIGALVDRLMTSSNAGSVTFSSLAATTLPWDGALSTSALNNSSPGSAGGGGSWEKDPATGFLLPKAASPAASWLCFNVSRTMDDFTTAKDDLSGGGVSVSGLALHFDENVFVQSDARAVQRFAERVWGRAHEIYSSLASETPSGEAKLQAAFDLVFCAVALLGTDRTPLPFSKGGVDAYSCLDVLKVRARAYAERTRMLHRCHHLPPPPGTVVPVFPTAQLLSVVEPVSRFTLLPVPQHKKGETVPPLASTSSRRREVNVANGEGNVGSSSSSSGGGLGASGLLKAFGF